MSFNPVDFYRLVSWLYGQHSPYDEARARAIISRAYYGAFLEARNRAHITDKSPGVHVKVHDHYFKSGRRALANRLDESRRRRNDADYDTAVNFTSMDSGKALKQARRILEELGVAL